MIFLLRNANYVTDFLSEPRVQYAIETADSVNVIITVCAWRDVIPVYLDACIRNLKLRIQPFFLGLHVTWRVRRDDKLATLQNPLTIRVGFDFHERPSAQEAS